MAEDVLRRGLLLRVATDALREASGPMPAKNVIADVEQRLDLNAVERSLNDSGYPRFDTYIRFASGWMAGIGWLEKSSEGWSLTPAGVAALDAHDDGEFVTELTKRYQVALKQKKATAGAMTDVRFVALREAVAAVPPGSWTSVADLVDLCGLTTAEITQHLAASPDLAGRHRVVGAALAPASPVRDQLRAEGIDVDATGAPDAEQRVTAEDLREVVGAPTAGARAWLVRGSAVSGVNVVPQWLAEEFVSIAAAHLTPVRAGAGLDELRAVVETDYAHLSYHQRKAKLAELHAFLNRMHAGDAVVTTADGRIHVGRVAGEAAFSSGGDTRTTIRRPISWQTGDVDFAALPEALQARLKATAIVVDVTDSVDAVESLFATDLLAPMAAPALREAVLPDLDDDAVDRLLVGRDWLHEFVDLLRTRRQVILHGPPGTGKTFLALEVAERLTDPANVTLVQFHPAYSYEDFFEGYRPAAVDDSGRVGFALTPGPFRKVVDAAKENPESAYILIIDEINRANLAKVFGELYFLLEYRDRSIDLMYASGDEGRDFSLPKNVYVIGTMNTADRSIALVDAAMRRRFAFLSLHPSDAHLRDVLRTWLERRELPTLAADLLDALNDRIPDRDFAIGPSYLMRTEAGTAEGLDRIWRTSILPLLDELHYGQDGFDVRRRYGLDALRAGLPAVAAPSASPAGDADESDRS